MKTKVNYRPKDEIKCGTCKYLEQQGFVLFCNYLKDNVYDGCVCDKWTKIDSQMKKIDKIRQMSVEEMAEFLAIETDCVYCKHNHDCDNVDCVEEFKKWLESEEE